MKHELSKYRLRFRPILGVCSTDSQVYSQEHKLCKIYLNFFILLVPWSNAFWPGLTPFGPPMWQAEADTELTLSASPTTAVGQKALALAKRRYSTVVKNRQH